MAEYIINTDKVESLWNEMGYDYHEYFKGEACSFMGNKVLERIVRCRDCEHNMSMGITQGWPHICTIGETLRIVEPDGFCKWGERREG